MAPERWMRLVRPRGMEAAWPAKGAAAQERSNRARSSSGPSRSHARKEKLTAPLTKRAARQAKAGADCNGDHLQ